MVYFVLLHVVEVNDKRAVAHEHLEYCLVLSVEGLRVGLVRQLYYSCELNLSNEEKSLTSNKFSRCFHLDLHS